MNYPVGDIVQTRSGTGRIVEIKHGQQRTLALVLYAPMTFPRWHDTSYLTVSSVTTGYHANRCS